MTSDLLGRAAAELRGAIDLDDLVLAAEQGITGAPDRHRQTGPGRVGAGGGVEHCSSAAGRPRSAFPQCLTARRWRKLGRRCQRS